MHWWKRDPLRTHGQPARPEHGGTGSLPAPNGSDPHSAQRSRYEVCPPSLLDGNPDSPRARIGSLLPPLTTVVRWLQTGWHSTDPAAHRREPHAAPRDQADHRLNEARAAFLAVIASLQPPAATELANRVHAAPTLRELWHLRNALFTQVSIDHCESVALARLAELNRFFVVRDHVPRARRRFGTRTDGFDPRRPTI